MATATRTASVSIAPALHMAGVRGEGLVDLEGTIHAK